MNLPKQSAEVEIVAASGTLRVTIRPTPHWLFLVAEMVGIVAIAIWALRAWPSTPWFERILLVSGELGAVIAWFKQFSGSVDEIGFDAQHLRIRRETVGWDRTSEYPIESCRDLELRTDDDNPHGLQCKLGWKTLEFGFYLSEEQAEKVIAALQDSLPEVAQKLLPSLDFTRHWTTLGLTERR